MHYVVVYMNMDFHNVTYKQIDLYIQDFAYVPYKRMF